MKIHGNPCFLILLIEEDLFLNAWEDFLEDIMKREENLLFTLLCSFYFLLLTNQYGSKYGVVPFIP